MNTSFERAEKDIATDSWLTLPYIIKSLGNFDLDPCSPIDRPWDPVAIHFTIKYDGLFQPWFGRVWLNTPYGKECVHWMEKLKEYGNRVALIFAKTETKNYFDNIWNRADALLFLKGILSFYKVDGTKGGTEGGPVVLVANVRTLEDCGVEGKFIRLK